MSSQTYTPQPGTFPARTIEWLRAQGPGEERYTAQIGAALGQTTAQVTPMLAHARDAGALHAKRCRVTGHTLWSIGDGEPLRAAGRDEGEPEDPAAEALEMVQRTVQWPPRNGARPKRAAFKLTKLDPAAVPIEHDVPIPALQTGRGAKSPYAALLKRMQPGDCVKLPRKEAAGLAAVARRQGVKTCVRQVEGGLHGVWRVE